MTALRLAGTLRINVQYGDVNAAGSYFAMLVCLTAGLTLRARRWQRLGWVMCGVLLAMALWLTSSRAALMALFVAALALTVFAGRVLKRRVSPRGLAIAAGSLFAAAVFTSWFLPNRLTGPGASVAVAVRRDMAIVALRLTAAHPLFGVGIGRFLDASGPQMQQLPVGRWSFQENAHNTFLQVLGELGLVGLFCFAGILWQVSASAWKCIRSSPAADRPLVFGFAGGVWVFLLSGLVGHPLLTPECAYAFWIVTGCLAGYSVSPTTPSAWHRAALTATAAALLISVPFRSAAAIRGAEFENIGYGVSLWQTDPDGVKYRIAASAGTIYVAADESTTDIPLRASGPPDSMGIVTVTVAGRMGDRIRVTGGGWTRYRLVIPANSSSAVHPGDVHPRKPARSELVHREAVCRGYKSATDSSDHIV